MSLETCTAAMFAPHVGEQFSVAAGDEGFVLRLDEIVERKGASRSPNAQRTPFNLYFAGPLRPILPQRIYRFRHDRLGELEIFIVPIGPAGDVMRYEAVFN